MELRFSETAALTSATSATPSSRVTATRRVCGLDELTRHETARVVSIDAAASPRFAALGFCPGTAIRLDRKAPLGDPLVFDVRGAQLALRRRDAHAIQVEVLAS